MVMGGAYIYYFIFIIDEYNRAKLSFIRATDGSDYINASYVDVSVYSMWMYTCI